MEDIVGFLHSGEKILAQVRPSPVIIFLNSFYSLILLFLGTPFIALSAAILLLLREYPFDVFRWTVTAVALIILLIGAIITLKMLIIILTSFIRARRGDYIVTNQRIITEKGITGDEYYGVPLENIKNVNVDFGIFDKIFKTGRLDFTGENAHKLFSFYGIKDVQNVHGEIVRFLSLDKK